MLEKWLAGCLLHSQEEQCLRAQHWGNEPGVLCIPVALILRCYGDRIAGLAAWVRPRERAWSGEELGRKEEYTWLPLLASMCARTHIHMYTQKGKELSRLKRGLRMLAIWLSAWGKARPSITTLKILKIKTRFVGWKYSKKACVARQEGWDKKPSLLPSV